MENGLKGNRVPLGDSQVIQRSGKVLARRSQETWRRGQLPGVFPELERTRFVDLEG